MFNIDYYADYIAKIGSTRLARVIYSVLVGAVGNMILVAFLGIMVRTATIGNLLPVIIGFNAALTGYMVLEKTRNGFIHKRVVSMGSGIAMVLVTAMLLNIPFFHGSGFYLIFAEDLMILLLVGTVTSWLGGMLAVKYFSLK
jgi:hypothetical protein